MRHLGHHLVVVLGGLELFDALASFEFVIAEDVLFEQHLRVVVQLLELFFGECRSSFGGNDYRLGGLLRLLVLPCRCCWRTRSRTTTTTTWQW